MNNIDAEKRDGQKRNREELARLRAELAESSGRLRELERELAAARYAPSEEPEPLPPINEEQDDENYMSYIPADVPESQASSPSVRENMASDGPQPDNVRTNHAPTSHRDQKIRDLESMIEVLRNDIAQRAEEERLRAQEDEVFHDAEEQILHEENHSLIGKIEELTTAKGKVVSFDSDVQEIGSKERESEDGYMGPLDDDSEEGITNIGANMAFRSASIDRGFGVSSQLIRASSHPIETDVHTSRVADLGDQNEQLQRTIDAQGEKIQEMEKYLEQTQISASEREKVLNKLRGENEKLRRLEKELEEKVIELEEMEGERLENVGHRTVQTDELVDQEKTEMEERMHSLAEQVAELQGMVEVVVVEKREIEARIAVAYSQVTSLQAAVEAGQVEKLEADSRIHALTMQVADLEDIVSQENKEAQHRIDVASTRIAQLKKVAEAGEAAKIKAEAEILAVTNRAKELEAAASKERRGVEVRVAELESAIESGKAAKIEAETQIMALLGRIKEHETFASEMKCVAQAQIADLQSVLESGKAAKAEAETQVLTLMDEIRQLEATIAEERRKVEAMIATTNSQIADLRATIEADESAKVEAEAQILELKLQIKDLEMDLSAVAEEKDEMQRETDELGGRVEELEIEIEELRVENAGIRQEVKIMVQKSKEFEEATDILKQGKASLEKDVENLKGEVEELEDAAETLRKVKASLETDSSNLNAQFISQQKALELAEGTREKFERNVVELRSHIEAFEQAADISRNEKESLERDVISLRTRVSSLEGAQKFAGDENRELQRNIDELHAQIGSFEQAIEAAGQEKEQLEIVIAELKSQIEALKRAEKVANQQKEVLEQTLVKLNVQLAQVGEKLDATCAENKLFRQEIDNQRSEIGSLERLLELSNREKKDLRCDIQKLESKVVLLEGSNEQNRVLQVDIEVLRVEINILKQAAEIADEEKSIIQQKIQPYIQGEQSLDMAVEEVLTELVMAKNRADEDERIKTELSNKIRILAQEDDNRNAEPISPEEMVESLTDRFREVRDSVEKLYELCGQTKGGPFEGYDLEDFAWTGSNESALEILGKLVRDMCRKVTTVQAQAEEMKEGWEKDKEQHKLYGGFLEDIVTAVCGEDQRLPRKDQALSLVTLRLSELRQQIEAAEEKVEELNGSVARKDNTIKDLEMNIDNAFLREVEINKRLVNSLSAHNLEAARLDKAQIDIGELTRVIGKRDEEIEKLEAMIEERARRERELLESIGQQAAFHNAAISELEQQRDEAIADVEERLAGMQEAKANAEHLSNQTHEKDTLIIKNLRDSAVAAQIEIEETNRRVEAMKVSHQKIVEELEGRLAQGRGDLAEASRKLRETVDKSNSDILSLKNRLKSSSDEVGRQQLSLKKVLAERFSVTRQLNAEIQSGQDAIASLEKQIQVIQLDAKFQYECDLEVIASFKATADAAEEEKKVLQARIQFQIEEVNELEDCIDKLEKKHAETIQEFANEVTKFTTRFGDTKNRCARDNLLRRAEGPRSRRKRIREEQDEEEVCATRRMPPTPASSVVAGPSVVEIVRKRESKRRRYDSGIGVEEDDEESEGVSQVGA